MRIEFDPAKSASNWRKHGLSLDEAEFIDWDAAIYRLDQRSFYGEWRALVMAPLAGRLHVAVFTERCGGAAHHQPAQGQRQRKDMV